MSIRLISFRKIKPGLIVLAILGFIAGNYYLVEPWAVTFVDDGPYYSKEYKGESDPLSLYSEIRLTRFGRTVCVLESRLTEKKDSSMLIFEKKFGKRRVVWKRVPLKPDGPLGPIKLTRQSLAWYGGWEVGIKPAQQEGGVSLSRATGRVPILQPQLVRFDPR